MTEEQKQEAVNECLESFDFEETHKIMKLRNHRWHGEDEVPTIYQIIKHATRMVNEIVYKDSSLVSTGGFTAVKWKYDDGTFDIWLFYGVSGMSL